MGSTIEDWRKQIDSIDEAIIDLIVKRFQVTHKVGKYKKTHNLPPQDTAREGVQFNKIESLSKKEDLNPKMVKDIFRLIINEVIETHKKISTK